MNKLFLIGLLFLHSFCYAKYYSQCSQDEYVHQHYFKDLNGGTFIDIGAHDGITYSNTYFFEQEKGWKGICIEPMPHRFAQLQAVRSCICIEGCVSDIEGVSQLLMVTSPHCHIEMLSGLFHKYDTRHLERVKREIYESGGSYEFIDVRCYILNELLENSGITHVNLLSIDTEGGEFDILSSINFSKVKIDVILVEDNYNDPRFIPFLEKKGYTFVKHLEQDLLFVRKDFDL